MIYLITSGLGLVALTVLVHILCLALLVKWTSQLRRHSLDVGSFGSTFWLLVRVVWAILLSHIIQICLWAIFYYVNGSFPSAESSLYFSGVTYTTIGYGDVVIAYPWRLLATTQGLVGILMCSLSAAFFFSLMTRLLFSRYQQNDTS